MTAIVVPLIATPSQELSIQLGRQPCQLKIYAKAFGLFIDVYVNDALIVGGVIARDRDRIVRSTYLGFKGDLLFVDTTGTKDPAYPGLGKRFLLVYDDLL